MSQKASGSVAPHKHCRVCGISISPGKDYCSNECRELESSAQAKMKSYRRITVVLMAASVAAVIILTVYLRLH